MNQNLIKPGRRVGNTTRLVDDYIQELFDGKEVILEDHANNFAELSITRKRQLSSLLLTKIINRLELEHRINTKKTFKSELGKDGFYYIKFIQE